MLRYISGLHDAVASYILRGIALLKMKLKDMMLILKANKIMIRNGIQSDKRGKTICFMDVAALNDAETYMLLYVSVVTVNSAISTGRISIFIIRDHVANFTFLLSQNSEPVQFCGLHELITCKKQIIPVVDELQIHTHLSLYARQSSSQVTVS